MSQEEIDQLLSKAELQSGRGEWAEALELYDRVLEGFPTHQWALEGRAKVAALLQTERKVKEYIAAGEQQVQAGRYDEAVETFTQALDCGGQGGVLVYHAAIEARRNQARDLAVVHDRVQRELEQARNLDLNGNARGAVELLDRLALALQEQPEVDLYAGMLEQVRTTCGAFANKLDAQARLDQAKKASDLNDYRRAIEYASIIPEGAPQWRSAQAVIKEANYHLGNFIEVALRKSEEAFGQQQWADAAAYLDELRDSYPQNPDWREQWLKVWRTHGEQCLDQGRQENAAYHFEQAAQLFAQAREAFEQITAVYPGHAAAPGWSAEAQDLQRIALDEGQAQASWQAGRWEDARAALGQAQERLAQARMAGRDYAAVTATVELMQATLQTESERIAAEERALGEADLRLQSKDLPKAAELYKRALNALLPEHRARAAQGLKQVDAEWQAFRYEVRKGQEAVGCGQWVAAVMAFQSARERWPGGVEVGQPITDLLEEALLRAAEALSATQPKEAARYAQQALQLDEASKRAKSVLVALDATPRVQGTLEEVQSELALLEQRSEVRPEGYDPLLRRLEEAVPQAKAAGLTALAAEAETLRTQVRVRRDVVQAVANLVTRVEERKQARDWAGALALVEETRPQLGDQVPVVVRDLDAQLRDVDKMLRQAYVEAPEAYAQAQAAYESGGATRQFGAVLPPLVAAENLLTTVTRATESRLPLDLEMLQNQVRGLRQRVELALQALALYETDLYGAVMTLRAGLLGRDDPVLRGLLEALEGEFEGQRDMGAAEYLQRAREASDQCLFTEALEHITKARGYRATDEIDALYRQIAQREELLKQLRDAENSCQDRLAAGSMIEAANALRRALYALRGPAGELSDGTRAALDKLLELADKEQESLAGLDRTWTEVEALLMEVGQAGGTWAAAQTFYFADQWIKLRREIATYNVRTSAAQVGNLRESYRAAVGALRGRPTDPKVQQEHMEALDRLRNQLNASARKRLEWAEESLKRGNFAEALRDLQDLDQVIYEPVDAEFPGMLDSFADVVDLRAQVRTMLRRAEQIQEIYQRAKPLLDEALQAYYEERLDAAVQKLRQIESQARLEETPELVATVADLRQLVKAAQVEGAREVLHDTFVAVEARLPLAVTAVDFTALREQLEQVRATPGVLAVLEEAAENDRYMRLMNQIHTVERSAQEGEQLYRRAQQYIAEENYVAAVEDLEKALAGLQRSADMATKDEVERLLETIRPRSVEQQQRQEALQEGTALFLQGEYRLAMRQLDEARLLGADVGFFLAAAKAGTLLLQAQELLQPTAEGRVGDPVAALEELEEALALGQDNPKAGAIVEEAERLKKKITAQLAKVAAVETELELARRSLDDGRVAEALPILQRVLVKDPDNTQAKELETYALRLREAMDLMHQAEAAVARADLTEGEDMVDTILDKVLPDYAPAVALKKKVLGRKAVSEALARVEHLANTGRFREALDAVEGAIKNGAARADIEEARSTVRERELESRSQTLDPIENRFTEGKYEEALNLCKQALAGTSLPDVQAILGQLQSEIVARWANRILEQARRAMTLDNTGDALDKIATDLDYLAQIQPQPAEVLLKEGDRLRHQAFARRFQLQLDVIEQLAIAGNVDSALQWLDDLEIEAKELRLPRVVQKTSVLRERLEQEVEARRSAEEETLRQEWLTEAWQKLAAAESRADLERAHELAKKVLGLPHFSQDGDATRVLDEAQAELLLYDATDKALKEAGLQIRQRSFDEAARLLSLPAISRLLAESHERLSSVAWTLAQAESAQRHEEWEAAVEQYQQALRLGPSLATFLEPLLNRCRERLLSRVLTRAQEALEEVPPAADQARHLLEEVERKGWISAALLPRFDRFKNWLAGQDQVLQASRLLEQNQPVPALAALAQARQLLPEDLRETVVSWEHLGRAAETYERRDLPVAQRLETVQKELGALVGPVAEVSLAQVLRRRLGEEKEELRKQQEQRERTRQQLAELERRADEALESAPPRYDEAIATLLRAHGLAPDDQPIERLRQRARVRLQGEVDRARQDGRCAQAVEWARRLVMLLPDDVSLVQQVDGFLTERAQRLNEALHKGGEAIQSGSLAEARGIIEQARRLIEPEGDSHLDALERQLADRAETLRLVDDLVSEARDYIGRDDWDLATERLLETIKVAPVYRPVAEATRETVNRLRNLALARKDEERYAEAEHLCDLALRLSNSPDIIALRNGVLERRRDHLHEIGQWAAAALDAWDLEEGERILLQGRQIIPDNSYIDRLYARWQQTHDLAPSLSETFEGGWKALDVHDYRLARESFELALAAAPGFHEAERWRDYAGLMARAVGNVVETRAFTDGIVRFPEAARQIKEAEALMCIGSGERLASVLGGQPRLRQKRRQAVYDAVCLGESAGKMACIVEQVQMLQYAGGLDELKRARQFVYQLQQEISTFEQLLRTQLVPRDDFSAECAVVGPLRSEPLPAVPTKAPPADLSMRSSPQLGSFWIESPSAPSPQYPTETDRAETPHELISTPTGESAPSEEAGFGPDQGKSTPDLSAIPSVERTIPEPPPPSSAFPPVPEPASEAPLTLDWGTMMGGISVKPVEPPCEEEQE